MDCREDLCVIFYCFFILLFCCSVNKSFSIECLIDCLISEKKKKKIIETLITTDTIKIKNN